MSFSGEKIKLDLIITELTCFSLCFQISYVRTKRFGVNKINLWPSVVCGRLLRAVLSGGGTEPSSHCYKKMVGGAYEISILYYNN